MRTSSQTKRALFHLIGGLSNPVAALLVSRTLFVSSLCAVTFTFLSFELMRLRVPRINRWFFSHFSPLLREREGSHPTGASYALVASLATVLAFEKDIAVLALSFLALADPIAAIFGRRIGNRRLFDKTLEGALACFISCVAPGLIAHYLGSRIPSLTIAAGVVAATVVEAIPLPVDDNLAMPLSAGLMMTVMQFSSV